MKHLAPLRGRSLGIESLESRELLAGTLPGDYNLNDLVDTADLVIWRNTVGQSVSSPGDGADGNADGIINQKDYGVWAANFGRTPPNWFDSAVVDEAMRSVGSSLYRDGLIDRGDMLALFQSCQDEGTVDAVEMNDLKSIVGNTTLFGSNDTLEKLTSYVVLGTSANTSYQGQALGNLVAGASATQLNNLVNKWFLGLDRPTSSYAYSPASGQLFIDGPSYQDIKQGVLNDCGLLASLAEVAWRNPATITNMFIVNGDGTYTVRFYNDNVAEYVTVDSFLPTSNERLVYAGHGTAANDPNAELWVALAEKAGVQLNEFSWCRLGFTIPAVNSYAAIEGTYIYAALGHLSGKATVAFSPLTLSSFVTAYNQGQMIGLASVTNPSSSLVVSNHAYAVVGFDETTETVTLFNPWGTGSNNGGMLTMTWDEIQLNFMYFDRTA